MSFCEDCKNQEKLGRYDKPHSNLQSVDFKSFNRPMVGGYEETYYKCSVCKAEVTHTNDKHEFRHWFVCSPGR